MSKNYTIDDNGYIEFSEIPISKSGVFPYLGKEISVELEPDRVYKAYRAPEEISNSATIESFKLTPWIPRHEMLGAGFTAAESVGVEGTTGEKVTFKDGTLFSNLKLFGESLKKAIKRGIQELSCGYTCKWLLESGVTPDGQEYDVKQVDIRGNHLASVPEGRMGGDVKVSLDALKQELIKNLSQQEVNSMTKDEIMKAINSLEAEDKKAVFNSMRSEMGDSEKEDKKAEDEVKEKAKEGDKAMDTIYSKIAELENKIESRKSSIAQDQIAQIEKAINERNDFISSLNKHIKDVSCGSMQEIAVDAAKKLNIACDSSDAVATVKGYLAAKSYNNPLYSAAQDSIADISVNLANNSSGESKLIDAFNKLGI